MRSEARLPVLDSKERKATPRPQKRQQWVCGARLSLVKHLEAHQEDAPRLEEDQRRW